MKRLLLFALCCSLLVSIPAAAQEQNTLDRVDQAMVHLTEWLGLENTITREVSFWQWREASYTDAAFDCGVPGVDYPDTPNRAFDITINVDGVDYDYRVSGDGAILVLCGADGLPLYRNDTPVDAPAATPAADDPADIPDGGSDWYTLIYTDGTDLLRLIGPEGEEAAYQRPRFANEAVPREIEMAVSRDGKYLVQAGLLASGEYALSIYNFERDTSRVIAANAGEEISLGAGSNLIFNADSTEVAVGFGRLEPGLTDWRMVVFDLLTGSPLYEINHDEIAPILTGGDAGLTDALSGTTGTFFPQIAYFDEDGGIHARLILMFAGGALEYPAFVWYPLEDSAAPSPYIYTEGDILTATGQVLYTYVDDGQPTPPGEGMFTPRNAIAVGTPTGTGNLQQQTLQLDGNYAHSQPTWAAGGDQILFRAATSSEQGEWALRILDGREPFYVMPEAYQQVTGVPDGFLAMTTVTEGGADVFYHTTQDNGVVIYTVPPRNGEPTFLWSLPAGYTFYTAEEVEVVDDVVSTSVPGGVVNCTGTIPSAVTVGDAARVTFTDGSPLNVRIQPDTSADIVDVLPEGSEFEIIGGPQCADGYTWWQVELPGATLAWAAEGDSDTYFIEPQP